MDETGFYILLGLLGIIAIVAGIWFWEWRRQRRSSETAVSWPGDNYYSGRFSLSNVNTDADELIRRMIGRKIQIHYDPSSPEVWFIPEESVEGCKVEQKIGPHVIAMYPRE